MIASLIVIVFQVVETVLAQNYAIFLAKNSPWRHLHHILDVTSNRFPLDEISFISVDRYSTPVKSFSLSSNFVLFKMRTLYCVSCFIFVYSFVTCLVSYLPKVFQQYLYQFRLFFALSDIYFCISNYHFNGHSFIDKFDLLFLAYARRGFFCIS